MIRPLLRKNIQESLLLFMACGGLAAAFCFFRVWVVGRIDTGRFRQIIELLPKDWERFSSVNFDWIVSYLGRTATTLGEPMLVLLVSAWAIVRGADVVGGELGRGTMEMLLAQPVSRRRVFACQFFINLAGILLLVMICWLAMYCAVQVTMIRETIPPGFRIPLTSLRIPFGTGPGKETFLAMRTVVDARMFGPGILNLGCFAVFFAGLSSLLSSLDRYGWRALGLAAATWFVLALVHIASMATPSLSWLGWGTVFSLYEPELHVQVAEKGMSPDWSLMITVPPGNRLKWSPWVANLTLLAGGLFLAWIGQRAFERRDLPAPS